MWKPGGRPGGGNSKGPEVMFQEKPGHRRAWREVIEGSKQGEGGPRGHGCREEWEA